MIGHVHTNNSRPARHAVSQAVSLPLPQGRPPLPRPVSRAAAALLGRLDRGADSLRPGTASVATIQRTWLLQLPLPCNSPLARRGTFRTSGTTKGATRTHARQTNRQNGTPRCLSYSFHPCNNLQQATGRKQLIISRSLPSHRGAENRC